MDLESRQSQRRRGGKLGRMQDREFTSRSEAQEHDCPRCGAVAGRPCIGKRGKPRESCHLERHQLAADAITESSSPTADTPEDCALHGHDLEIIREGGQTSRPVSVLCIRCGASWDVVEAAA